MGAKKSCNLFKVIEMRQPGSSIFVVDGGVFMKGANFSLNILVPPKSDGWPLAFYMYVNLCREGGSKASHKLASENLITRVT